MRYELSDKLYMFATSVKQKHNPNTNIRNYEESVTCTCFDSICNCP